MSRCLLIGILFVAALQAWGVPPDSYTIQKTGPCSEKEVAEGIRNALQTQGVRLLDVKGTPVSELWLRQTIPLKAGASGANYSALNLSTLVGVLRFPAQGSDFRGQPIKAGLYTLRYAQIPQDGNHMGAAPQPDFLLLIPAAADKELDAKPKFEDLVKLSRQASGTNHPAILMLMPPSNTTSAALQRSDQGYVVVGIPTQAKPEGTGKAADFAFSIVLVGKAE